LPSGRPTHVSTKRRASDSESRPCSAVIRTWPSSRRVLHVPHLPCRQAEVLSTPAAATASRRICPPSTAPVPDRAKSNVQGGLENMSRIGAGVPQPWHPDKCSGAGHSGDTYSSRVRLRSENAGRPGEPYPDGTGSVPAEEIAMVFAVPASDDASYLTDQTLYCSSGRLRVTPSLQWRGLLVNRGGFHGQ